MKIQSTYIPDTWKPEDSEAMNRWFNKLPNVVDLELAFEIDQRYELFKLKV